MYTKCSCNVGTWVWMEGRTWADGKQLSSDRYCCAAVRFWSLFWIVSPFLSPCFLKLASLNATCSALMYFYLSLSTTSCLPSVFLASHMPQHYNGFEKAFASRTLDMGESMLEVTSFDLWTMKEICCIPRASTFIILVGNMVLCKTCIMFYIKGMKFSEPLQNPHLLPMYFFETFFSWDTRSTCTHSESGE